MINIQDVSLLKITKVRDWSILFDYDGKHYLLHGTGESGEPDRQELYERNLNQNGKYDLKENNAMKDSVKETLKRLGISLTKETAKGPCMKTSYELLEELAKKWETQLLKD